MLPPSSVSDQTTREAVENGIRSFFTRDASVCGTPSRSDLRTSSAIRYCGNVMCGKHSYMHSRAARIAMRTPSSSNTCAFSPAGFALDLCNDFFVARVDFLISLHSFLIQKLKVSSALHRPVNQAVYQTFPGAQALFRRVE